LSLLKTVLYKTTFLYIKNKKNEIKKLKKYLTYTIFILIISVLNFNDLIAQLSWDSKGKDFWLTFIPNFHNWKYSQDPQRQYLDSLSIYITSEKPTKGTIVYRDINNHIFTHKFSIIDTNKIHRFKLPYRTFELEGYNDNAVEWKRNQCEKIAPQSFHITSEEDISVYALNQATYTSDAFLVFPTDVLGEDYYILSYNGDGSIGENKSRTPSQFAIVASEDGTTVDINPSTATYVNGLRPVSITMNKGEVYLVQSAFTKKDTNPDLTGTIVKADKPIAVFSGHQRSKIPVYTGSYNSSRDILVEQLQPFKNWGKNAFIIPLVQPYKITIDGTDLFRIIAAEDDTKIYLNGEYITTLNSAQFFEAPADKIFIIRATKPISVAQYKKTSRHFDSDLNISDPYMLIIPPKEQYLNSYRIINTESWDFNGVDGYYRAFSEHYITMIIPDTALQSMRIDGKPVPIRKFKPIPNSGYSYINYPSVAGVHSATCSAAFGIYISGFGLANSYGYLGGMNFKQLNFRPPRIYSTDTCDILNGIFTKYSRTDYGVWGVDISDDNNVNVSVHPYNDNDDSVRFEARLIDYRRDGRFVISVRDSLKNTNRDTFNIYGFTVGLIEDNVPDTLLVIERSARAHTKSNGIINITNYGNKLQTIKSVFFGKTEFSVISSQFLMLPPEESTQLEYEFFYDDYPDKDIVIDDTIWISNDCYERPLAIIRYTVPGDKESPAAYNTHTNCDTMSVAVFTETRKSDFGLMDYSVIRNDNCVITNTVQTPERFEFKIIQRDKRIDALYQINAIDSAGNISTIADTIDGNMLYIEPLDTNYTYSFGERTVGFLWCDSLLIRNKSSAELKINKIKISRNIEYGIPMKQLPFIVPPGETKAIYICFKPGDINEKEFRDTILINLNCVEQIIILTGKSKTLTRNGTSQCGAEMTLLTTKVPKTFFVDNVFPNPVSVEGKIRVAIPEESKISLKIYNILGQQQLVKSGLTLRTGIYELSIDMSQLEQGVYYLVIFYNNRPVVKSFRKISG
jgi:hypothetical protein